MDIKDHKEYYNLCDPDEPQQPGSDLYVDFDGEWTGEECVRGQNWAENMAFDIEFSKKRVCLFFTGLKGSGKTTELLRLGDMLTKAGLLAVRIDADEVIDLSNEISISDILTNVLYAAEKETLKLEGRDPEDALKESYLARFLNWLKTEVDLKSVKLSLPRVGELVFEMRANKSLRSKVQQFVESNLSRFVQEIHEEIELINERVRKVKRNDEEYYSGIVVIFDSLEKLLGMTSNWKDVLKSAERVFGTNASYLQLPVHVLYTVPPALLSRTTIRVDFLPMLKIKNRDDSPFAPGIQAARELVRKRIPDDALRVILGDDFELRIRKIIEMSGGYPRDIVRMLRGILRHRTFPLQDHEFHRVINENSEAYQRLIFEDDLPWLAKVAIEKEYRPKNDDHHVIADRIMTNNLVMRYINRDDWYDLHPGVLADPAVQRAIEKCKADMEAAKTREADGPCQQPGE